MGQRRPGSVRTRTVWRLSGGFCVETSPAVKKESKTTRTDPIRPRTGVWSAGSVRGSKVRVNPGGQRLTVHPVNEPVLAVGPDPETLLGRDGLVLDTPAGDSFCL